MNEIKQIHLGRQAFTVAVDAYKELQQYLHAIERAVGESHKEVIEEVELRMAELLGERGIKGEKVVLKSDIDYLKEQLGQPDDFAEDGKDQASEPADDAAIPRRLFRDTSNATIAGVAAGIGAYFGISVLFVRLAFVALTLLGASGILIYIILWLVVPEAKTQGERLQMRGKAVTVDSLKEIVDRADVEAVANRASHAFGRFLHKVFTVAGRVIGGVLGVALIIGAVGMFLWAVIMGAYIMFGGHVGGVMTVPGNFRETAMIYCIAGALILLSSVFMLAGLSIFRRKWPVAGWIVGAIAGLFLLVTGIGAALAFNVLPDINDRYQALHHNRTQKVADFHELNLKGSMTGFTYEYSQTPSIEYRYFGESNKDLGVETRVENGVLSIDASEYQRQTSCRFLCVYDDEYLTVVIHGPKFDVVTVEGAMTTFSNETALNQPSLKVVARDTANAYVKITNIDKAVFENSTSGLQSMMLYGLTPGDLYTDAAGLNDGWASVGTVKELQVNTNGAVCDMYSPSINVNSLSTKIVINNKAVTRDELRGLYTSDHADIVNCISAN